MNKLFKSIIAASVGVAMVIGVGVGLGREAKAVYAESYTISCSERASTLGWTNANAYTSWKSENDIFTVTASGGGNNGKWYTSGGGSWRMYSGGTVTISCSSDYIISAISSSPTCSWTVNSQSASFSPSARTDFTSFTITYSSASGPSVESLTVEGNMTKNSYTTVESWSSAGLTATVSMNDGSSYPDEIGWEYSPASPSEAVIANNNENVTGLDVTATALAGGLSASKTTDGISVSIATISQAVAAIQSAQKQIDGVIVKGIISQIDSYSSTYNSITYWISEDGTTTNQFEVYSGKGLNGVNFSNETDIELGASVIIFGNIKEFTQDGESVYEFNMNSRILSYTDPVSPLEKLEKPQLSYSDDEISWTAVLHASSYDLTIDDGEPIHNATSPYALNNLTALSVHTVSVTAIGDNVSYSNSNPGSLSFAKLEQAGTSDEPYDIANATAAIDGGYETQTQNVCVAGIVSQVDKFNSGNSITYWISEDGTTTNQFEVYKGKGLNNADFSDINGVKVGAEVVVFGNLKKYNSIYEFDSGNYLVSYSYTPAKTLSSISISNQETEFVVGDTFVFGGTVTATYSDNSTDDVTARSDYLGYDMSTAGVQTITVRYTEDGITKETTYNITVSEPAPEDKIGYTLYTDDLVEGDYIIVYNHNAMKAEVSSNRLSYSEVTIVNNNTINARVNSDANIVWHIAPNNGHWTIYNAADASYAGGNGTKNQAALLSDGESDYALWTVTKVESAFEFVNKGNTADGVNSNLRNNGTYGFACYATSTGGALSLFKKTSDNPVSEAQEIIEGLNTHANLSYTCSKTGGVKHILNNANTIKETTTSYKEWANNSDAFSGIVYNGQSAGSNASIQLRSNNNNSGIITSANGKRLFAKTITVKWSEGNTEGRQIDIYGKNTKYDAPSDLYDANTQGTSLGSIACGTSTQLTITGDYEFIGIRSNNGALYLDSIDIQWGAEAQYTYSEAVIRFGGSIAPATWTQLEEETNIVSYGVMFSTGEVDLKALYNSKKNDSNTIDQAIALMGITDRSTAITDSHKTPNTVGGNYVWNLCKRITSESDLTPMFSAIAYIRVEDNNGNEGIIFLQGTSASAQGLAQEMINSDKYDENSFGGSLYKLATYVAA